MISIICNKVSAVFGVFDFKLVRKIVVTLKYFEMSNAKIREADAFVSEAEKHLKTSFFKWRPDYDSAAASFQKAALAYKNGKALEKAAETYVKLADCHYKNNSRFHAGKAYEEAGQVYKEMKDFGKTMAHYDHASELYLEDGTPDTAALCLDRAGKIVQMSHPQWAIASFQKAAEIYENEDESRYRSAAELIAKVARLQVGLQKYDEAIKSIAHEQKLLTQVQGGDHGANARLTCALVLILLTNGDQVHAQQKIDIACETMDGFEETEEFVALNNLIEAFDKADQKKVSQIANTPLFKYMDTAYAKLARSLRVPGYSSDAKVTIKPEKQNYTVEEMSAKVDAVTQNMSELQAAANAILPSDTINIPNASNPSSSPSKSQPAAEELDLC